MNIASNSTVAPKPPARGVRCELMKTATAIPPKVCISRIPPDMGMSKQGWEFQERRPISQEVKKS